MAERNTKPAQTARSNNPEVGEEPQVKKDLKTELLEQAIADQRAFLNDVDRKGPVMEATIDHRVRVEKFLNDIKQLENN